MIQCLEPKGVLGLMYSLCLSSKGKLYIFSTVASETSREGECQSKKCCVNYVERLSIGWLSGVILPETEVKIFDHFQYVLPFHCCYEI